MFFFCLFFFRGISLTVMETLDVQGWIISSTSELIIQVKSFFGLKREKKNTDVLKAKVIYANLTGEHWTHQLNVMFWKAYFLHILGCDQCMSLFTWVTLEWPRLSVLCLHADKAKGLQINLSQALQGKTPPDSSSLAPPAPPPDPPLYHPTALNFYCCLFFFFLKIPPVVPMFVTGSIRFWHYIGKIIGFAEQVNQYLVSIL